MKPNTIHAFEQLTSAIDSNGENSLNVIDLALATIVQEMEPECAALLLLSLADDFQFDEAMFSIIHAAERFDDKIYTASFLTVITCITSTAPRWASVIFVRILNNEETKIELIKLLAKSNPAVKKSVEELCHWINRQSTDFLSSTLAVLVAAR